MPPSADLYGPPVRKRRRTGPNRTAADDGENEVNRAKSKWLERLTKLHKYRFSHFQSTTYRLHAMEKHLANDCPSAALQLIGEVIINVRMRKRQGIGGKGNKLLVFFKW